MKRDDVLAALRHLAARYVGARRAAGELRVRLVAIEHERAQWLKAVELRERSTHAKRQLAEVERVRRALARSTHSTTERLSAVEAVIAAVAADAITQLVTESPEREPVEATRRTRLPLSATVPVRGGFTAPTA